ncbi:MAG: response regulator [Rhodospirillaceae bacterium]|nr:MAG: response regulator [Rhodospirillaceae bacterium]
MAIAPAEKIDPARLAAVSVYLLERNNEVANSMRTMLRGVGMAGVKTFPTPDELEANLGRPAPDVLILSESEGSDIFEVTKRVRRAVVGKNPFTVILLLVTTNNPESIKAALMSGADSALVKPVASGQLVDRISQLAFSRAPFIATTDYIGPERRNSGRPSDIPLIQTINTLRYKLERKTIAPEALEKAIASTTIQLWLGQLKSHSLKLQFSCNVAFEHHRAQRPEAEVKASLLDLVAVLEDAATTAQRIDRPDMLKTCHDLAKEIKALASDTDGLEDHKIKMIALIPAAFEQARQKLSPQA